MQAGTQAILYWAVLLLAGGLMGGAAGQTLQVSSSSNGVGESVNYTYSFSGMCGPTQVQMSFTDWSSNSARPYQSTTMCYQFNTPITPAFLPPSTVVCSLAVSSSSPVLTLTNMLILFVIIVTIPSVLKNLNYLK